VIRTWLLRVLCWDGVLPLFTALAPLAVDVLTGNRNAVEAVSIALPVIAFLIRFFVGLQTIMSNDCHPVTRFFQFVVFFGGLLLLCMVDAMLMMAYTMPPGAMFATVLDVILVGAFYAFYLATMMFAMYPGQRPLRPIPSIATELVRPDRLLG
jgi:hypothetical protein